MDAADCESGLFSKTKQIAKVRDLSIVRTAGHKKYEAGDITGESVYATVDVHGGRPEPITIRYVYKFTLLNQ